MALVSYDCAACHREIPEGERFWIAGVMSAAIRRGDIARTDVQVKTLGTILCASCAKDELETDTSDGGRT